MNSILKNIAQQFLNKSSWDESLLLEEMKKYALKCFISLDIELSTKQILKRYLNRWLIEAFFRETTRLLGYDKYQIHTITDIKRYMYLLMLTYLYCELAVHSESLRFSKGLKKARNEVKQLEITCIYKLAMQGVSLQSI